MSDLCGYERTLGMNCLGQPAQPWTSWMHSACVRPSGATDRYATVVMATPPAATPRWNSMSESVTSPSGLNPSKVAAFITRFRSVNGPSRAGSNKVETPGAGVAGAVAIVVVGRTESDTSLVCLKMHHSGRPARPSASSAPRSAASSAVREAVRRDDLALFATQTPHREP